MSTLFSHIKKPWSVPGFCGFLLLLLFCQVPAHAAITYFASASNPADGVSLDSTTVAVTPPGSMQVGDLVILVSNSREADQAMAISANGGQTWTSQTANTTNVSQRIFWARYNGTWSANPSVSFPSGANGTTVVMRVFRPSSTTNTWALDVAQTNASYSAPDEPRDVTITGITTVTDGALVFATWVSRDNNTWGLQTAGWANAGLAQYRNLDGKDTSQSAAYKIMATAGASGNVTNRQLTLGGDPGNSAIIAFREVFPPTITKSFSPASIATGGTSTLTVTLTNQNATAITGAAFTDTYPANVTNTASPGLTNTCGGTATAAANGTSLALSGGTIPASGSCTVIVAVTSTVVGSYLNSTGTVITANAGTGTAATATLTVTSAAPGSFNAFETDTAANAITGVIRTKVAGTSFNLALIALNSAKTAIQTTFTGTVKVELLDSSSGGTLDANGCNAGWPTIQTLATNPVFVAGDNGRKTVSFQENNAWRNARVRISFPATGAPTAIGCSSDNFAIRPNTFASFAVTDTDWQTAGTGRALTEVTFGTVTHKAGRPLSVRATAVNSVAATTTNYVGAPTATPTTCVGAACTASFGALTLTTTFVAGQLASDVASYNNVGSFALQLVDSTFAGVDAADGSTLAERNIVSPTINVGRFVPDHFAVSLNTPVFGTDCGSFTYIGRAFNYTTAPVITVTARDFANNTTTLYNTTGSWFRITSASLTGKAYTAASGTLDVSGLPGTDPVIVAAGSGMGTLTFSSGTGLFFTRTTPVAPFNADISLAINVIDADGVILATNPARFGTATAGNGIAFSGGKGMRYGRLRLINAYGSELLPARVEYRAEYWDGNRWVTNTADNCSGIAPGNIARPTALSVQGTPTFSNGVGFITFAPTAVGSYDIALNLSVSGNDTSCNAAHGGTAANRPWLKGHWSAPASCGGVAAWAQDPNARIRLGSPKAPYIYLRERY